MVLNTLWCSCEQLKGLLKCLYSVFIKYYHMCPPMKPDLNIFKIIFMQDYHPSSVLTQSLNLCLSKNYSDGDKSVIKHVISAASCHLLHIL